VNGSAKQQRLSPSARAELRAREDHEGAAVSQLVLDEPRLPALIQAQPQSGNQGAVLVDLPGAELSPTRARRIARAILRAADVAEYGAPPGD
jgi:hypothetical protein